VTAARSEQAPSYPIASVDNALRVLDLIKSRRTVRVADVSAELGIARSSAHRLLTTLRHRGYLRQDSATKAYGAGPALVEVGLAAVRDIDVRRLARPHMERLSQEVGETVSLLLLQQEGVRVVFVDSIEGPQSVRVGSRTGLTMPAHCNSGGKAMLAALPPETLRELFGDGPLATMTEASIATLVDLEAELERVRGAGYATNFGESEDDISAVGVAISGLASEAVAAFSAAAPAARLSPRRAAEIAGPLRAAAAALSAEIGAR
jgi:DNA-binding IclR family transcriptional regulator